MPAAVMRVARKACFRGVSVVFCYVLAVVIVEHMFLFGRVQYLIQESDQDNVIQNVKLAVHNETRMVTKKVDTNATQITSPSLSQNNSEEITQHKENATIVKTGAKQAFVQAKFFDGVLREGLAPADRERTLREAKLERSFFRLKPSKVNPYIYDYVVKPKDLCDEKTHMLVLIHSFHPYADRRRAIRSTWGSIAHGGQWPRRKINESVKLAFVLGRHKDPGLDDMCAEENEVNNDIIQGSFMDSYNNMTLKSLLGLRFFIQHCPQAKFLLKSDDDMIVNIPHLLNVLRSTPMQRSVMGPLNQGAKVYRSGKWKLSQEQYPFKYFPPYESGAAYVIDNSLVTELFEAAEYVPHIFIDDVYITGILGKILNITHVVQSGFAYWLDKAPTSCDINEDIKIAGTKMKPAIMLKLWKDLQDDVRNCPIQVRNFSCSCL